MAVRIRRRAGGVSSASHLPREHWLTVDRGPEVFEKLNFRMKAPDRFRWEYFARRHGYHTLVHAKPQLDPYADQKWLAELVSLGE